MAQRTVGTHDSLPLQYTQSGNSRRNKATCACCRRRRRRKKRLLRYDEVPSYMKRPHIVEGYRSDLSTLECVQSVVEVHNETGNIWSHIFGCMLSLRLAWGLSDGMLKGIVHDAMELEVFPKAETSIHFPSPSDPFPEGLVLQLYLGAAAVCLLMSSIYHIGCCSRNEDRCALLLRLDMSGVAMLISASFLPGVYYGFACHEHLQYSYLWSVGVMFAIGFGANVLGGSANDPRAHRVRYLIMAFLVAIAACVAVNWALLVAPEARGVLGMGVAVTISLYAVGFTFYASKWPESSWPGCFDYFLHSHQLWHMCVVAAVYIWYRACLASSRLLDERGCVAFVRVNDGTTMLRVRSSFELKVEPATVDSISP